jgi:hypothetical protein
VDLSASVDLAIAKKYTPRDSISLHWHVINKLMLLMLMCFLEQPRMSEHVNHATAVLNPRDDVA